MHHIVAITYDTIYVSVLCGPRARFDYTNRKKKKGKGFCLLREENTTELPRIERQWNREKTKITDKVDTGVSFYDGRKHEKG